MDRKFAYFFITGDASVQLPSDSLSGTNFKLSSDNLYGTEGVVSMTQFSRKQWRTVHESVLLQQTNSVVFFSRQIRIYIGINQISAIE